MCSVRCKNINIVSEKYLFIGKTHYNSVISEVFSTRAVCSGLLDDKSYVEYHSQYLSIMFQEKCFIIYELHFMLSLGYFDILLSHSS